MTRTNFVLIAALIAIAMLAGCTPSEQSTTAVHTPPPLAAATPPATPRADVVLRVSVEADAGLRPKVVGETNLPDDTELMVTVEAKSTNFTGQDKASVKRGRFEAGPFGPDGGLKPGHYTADVVMPDVQADAVRAVIGDKGQNLRGPLVKQGILDKTIEVETKFQVSRKGVVAGTTGDDGSKAAQREARAVLRALRAVERQGRSMEPLRNTDDLAKVRRCGELMRERQKQVKELATRAEALPTRLSFDLSVAATELNEGVSCAGSALENCRRARASLDEAERLINAAKP